MNEIGIVARKNGKLLSMANHICDLINNHKTVAVVDVNGIYEVAPIVRCKDCKWGEPTKNCYGEDRIICGNDDTYIDRYITVPADWFCADGERKEGDVE